MKRMLTTLCLLAAVALAGCSYYRITDPTSDTEYYTTSYKRMKGTGGIEFEDKVSGSTVTLQNSEITKISDKEFKAATKDG